MGPAISIVDLTEQPTLVVRSRATNAKDSAGTHFVIPCLKSTVFDFLPLQHEQSIQEILTTLVTMLFGQFLKAGDIC
jgi:hypothetical protein